MVWYGLNWSLELYQQANARLYRQGQDKATIIHHLIINDTVDERVLETLEGKSKTQNALLDSVMADLTSAREGGITC